METTRGLARMNCCGSLIEAIPVKSKAVIISQPSVVQRAHTQLQEDKNLFLAEVAPKNLQIPEQFCQIL